MAAEAFKKKAAAAKLPTMKYFEFMGRAEPIRMACFLKDVKYNDERLTGEQFAAAKAAGELPLGSMPVWIEDGQTICQSGAVLRMIGARYGLYSDQPSIAWNIDSILEYTEDLFSSGSKKFSGGIFSGNFTDEHLEGMLEFHTDLCKLAERRLQQHGKKFLAGTDSVTIADCKFAHMFYFNVFNDASPVKAEQKQKLEQNLKKYPLTDRYITQTMKQCLSGYLAARPAVPA